MPTNIPVGYGSATYAFAHESSSNPLAITLGVALPDPGVDPVDVANALVYRFRETILTDLDNSLTLLHVDLFIGNGDDPSGSVRSTFGNDAGERAMNSIPLNTAVLVNKTTGFLGRRGRGRMSVPSSAATTEVSEIGILNSAIITSLQTRWDEFYDMLTTGGEPGDPLVGTNLQPVILHQTPPYVPTPITGFQVGAKIATRPTRIR